jgi:4-hydroxy-tetrahydrodipicolinate synthase
MSESPAHSPALKATAHGVWPVAFTPFATLDRVDLGVMAEQIEFYAGANCAGVFVVAQSGEMEALTQAERVAIARESVRAAGGRLGIVAAGNFGETLGEQARAIEEIAAAGVDSVIVNVSTLPVEREDSASYTQALLLLAGMTDAPLGIYECPAPIHRLLEPPDVAIVAGSGRFNFMKETSRQMDPHTLKVRAAQGTAMGIYQANLQVFLEPWVEGLAGFSGIIANIFPEHIVHMCEQKERDTPYKQRVGPKLVKYQTEFLARNYPASGKYQLRKRGIGIKDISRRLGLEELGAEDRKVLDACDEIMVWLYEQH